MDMTSSKKPASAGTSTVGASKREDDGHNLEGDGSDARRVAAKRPPIETDAVIESRRT